MYKRQQQYHIGALRNNNLRQFKLLGPDVGFDSINDRPMSEELSKLLSKQNEEKDVYKRQATGCMTV